MPIETVPRLPESFTEYNGDTLMSNYDREINETTAADIKGKELFSRYAEWYFNGKVWWADNQWNCEVWQYRHFMETISAATLTEIMENVSETYGYD